MQGKEEKRFAKNWQQRC